MPTAAAFAPRSEMPSTAGSAALKRAFDPDNLFRSNQNIVPAPA
jgi:FAD/FMN-containing dehydrogenase